MVTNTKKYGIASEKLVSFYLSQIGYNIIYQNYWTKWGEIDLIAKIDHTLVFCEVKARRKHGDFELVSRAKTIRCCNAAAFFLINHPDFESFDMRFDLVYVVGDQVQQHLIGAWECASHE